MFIKYLLLNFKKRDLIITNCDILLNSNIENFYKSHKKNKNDLTIVISQNKIKSPYGSVIVDHKSMRVMDMKEKPEFKMLTNIGFYIGVLTLFFCFATPRNFRAGINNRRN